jgi:hypothetical protein
MSVTNFIYILLIALSLISCRSYKMLDWKSHRVSFTSDTSVFNDPDFPDPKLYYPDLRNISAHSANVVALKKNETVTAVLAYPTLFQAYDQFLVYPGEHITIKKAIDNEYTFIKTKGSEQKNRELSFFKVFSEKRRESNFVDVGHPSFDAILNLERILKKEIPGLEKRSNLLFDSLANALNVSRKFKRLARSYIENNGWINLCSFYERHKDTLLYHGVYKDKYLQLISDPFLPSRKSQIADHLISVSELGEIIMPHKIKAIDTQADFSENFDIVEKSFNGFARDFLISQLIYFAYTKRLEIPEGYLVKYNSLCEDRDLKKILNNLRKSQETVDKKAIKSGNNGLLDMDGNKVTSLEGIDAE